MVGYMSLEEQVDADFSRYTPEGVPPAYIGPSAERSHPQPSGMLRVGPQKARRGRRNPPRTEDCALNRHSGQCQPMLGVR
jgi:hypothetical protein